MKKDFFLLLILLLLFGGCDKIEGPYIAENTGSNVNVEFPDLLPEDLFRRILVEEYTGHTCANCPNGHAKLEEIHQIFGDTLVIVGIHAGALSRPNDEYPYDFRTEEGNLLFSDFGVNSIPRAFFNRSKLNIPVAEWIATVKSMDVSHSYAAIQLINEYNENRQELKVNTKTTMLSEYSSPLQIAIYLIEDNIIKPQLNGSTRIEEYEHKHVLRASANGAYGTRLTETGILEKDSSYTRAYPLSFSEQDWNVENCTVVVLLLDPETKEVIQVRAEKIVK